MVEEVTIALIGLIITAIGIIGALIYNAYNTKQNTKSRYYQILKDLEDRFHKIQDMDDTAPSSYFMHVVNFAGFMIRLIKEGIIPKDLVFPQYTTIFSESLWISNLVKDKTKVEDIIEFCKENNVKEEQPPKRRLQGKRIQTKDFTSLIFSSNPDKEADIYVCPKCRHMSGTKEELKKHTVEEHQDKN